jgi:hypothetical protein
MKRVQPCRSRPSRAMLFGFGIVLALLVSLPLIAIATGALDDSPQYVLMQNVPERGDGAYLQVNDGARQGVVKLYPWNFQLNAFPDDAPVFNPSHITGLVISQRGIDDPARYHLFDLEEDTPISLDAETSVTKILFTLRTPLQNGSYMLDMPKSGLSSDRQYLYFRVDESVNMLPVK